MTNAAELIRNLRRRIGSAGIAGVAMIVAGIVAYPLVVVPIQDRAAATLAEAEHLRIAPPPIVKTPEQLSAEHIDGFYRRFPPARNLPQWLEILHGLALKQGLSVARGEYKLNIDDDGKILRYEIHLPVRGSYPAMRSFIDAARQGIPALALDTVSLKRESVTEAVVDGQFGFVLLLRGQS